MSGKTIVETRDLTKIYTNGAEVRALDGVTMTINEGELVAIMGPSGSGKSTLLHLIGALDRPTSGQVIVAGQDLTTIKNLDRFRNKTIGFIFQLHNLIPTLTARENVEIPLYEQRFSSHERRQKAEEMLALVGLGDRGRHVPGQLSGGQRQRVAIARAMINNPAIILADEPTGELDSQTTVEIIELMHHLNRELGTTFIVVTHDPAVGRETERIIELDSGRIKQEHRVGDPFEEDWKVLRNSPLGKALLSGSQADLVIDGIQLYQNGEATETGLMLLKLLEKNGE